MLNLPREPFINGVLNRSRSDLDIRIGNKKRNKRKNSRKIKKSGFLSPKGG